MSDTFMIVADIPVGVSDFYASVDIVNRIKHVCCRFSAMTILLVSLWTHV
jgi:hypothetical protein